MNNPIIEAYHVTALQTPAERRVNEMFISPEDEWLQYIDRDLIGFEYTPGQAQEARDYILKINGER